MNLPVRTLLVTLVMFCVLAVPAQGFDPAEGTEIVFTDVAGEILLGYGVVESRELQIDLSQTSEAFLMLVVHPDGTFETLRGAIDETDRFLITSENGESRDLETVLEEANVELVIRRVREGRFEEDSDEDREEHSSEPSDEGDEADKDEESDEDNSGKDESRDEDEEPDEDNSGKDDSRDEDEESDEDNSGKDDSRDEDEESDEDNSGKDESRDEEPDDDEDDDSDRDDE